MVELLPGEFGQSFGVVAGDVNAQFCQDLPGQRVDPRRDRAGGKGLVTVAKVVVDQPFGHLGAAGVVGAEEKNPLFHVLNISA